MGGFAKYVRDVYIVHSDFHEPPNYLDRSDSKIHFVKHSDIIPAQELPTLDRNHIKAHLHNIPGLREWYFQGDDDCMLVNSGSGILS